MGSNTPNTPAFHLSLCTEADVPAISSVYLSAFSPNVLYQYSFPSSTVLPSELDRWLTHRFTALSRKSYIKMFKVTETTTGKVVAFCRWSFPHVLSDGEEEKEEREKEEMEEENRRVGYDTKWPKGANAEIMKSKFGPSGLAGVRERWCSEKEMYIADLLAVDPAYQRLGLGKLLLQHVLDMADKEGRKAFIEATDEGYGLYCKLGFKQVDVVYVDLAKWGGKLERNRVLVREPSSEV